LGEPDEKPFGPPDVAEPVCVFVLDHFADELRAALTKAGITIAIRCSPRLGGTCSDPRA
jgi:hypothetical protein